MNSSSFMTTNVPTLSQQLHSPSRIDRPGLFTSPAAFQLAKNLYSSKHDIEPEISQIHKRYETEAQDIKYKYEDHLQGHLKLGKRIEELEGLLAAESQRSNILQQKLDQLTQEYNDERRARKQVDQKILYVQEENRRKDHTIAEADLKNRSQQHEIANFSAEVTNLKEELARTNTYYNNRIREMEETHNAKTRQVNTQIENFRHQIERLQTDHAAQIRELNMEWELKLRKFEEQTHESYQNITELERQNRMLTEDNTKLRVDYEEQIRAVAASTKKEEYEKYLYLQKQLEAKLNATEENNLTLQKRVEELVVELQTTERRSEETRIYLEQEITRLKSECNELRNQLSIMTNNADRLRGDLIHKDGLNSKLHTDLKNLELEIERAKDRHRMELDRLRNDFSIERKRSEDVERSLRARIVELERQVIAAEDNAEKIRIEFQRTRELVSNNVSRVIGQSFTEYPTKPYGAGKLNTSTSRTNFY